MWRPIAGFQEYYRINEDGVIQSNYWGKWKTIKHVPNGERACVGLVDKDGKQKRVSVARLVFETFVRQLKPGEVVFHKDRDKWNCKLWNLSALKSGDIAGIVKGNRRAIQKVARNGEVVCIYKSVKEASRKEFVGYRAIYARCNNKIQDPFYLTGYTYQYDELRPGERRMNFAE